MSGTDEELRFVASIEVDHVTYVMIMFRSVYPSYPAEMPQLIVPCSLAFLIYLHTLFLLNLYFTTGRNASATGSRLTGPKPETLSGRPVSANGYIEVPPSPWYPGVGQDAEVFELGPVEDDDDDDQMHRLVVPTRR